MDADWQFGEHAMHDKGPKLANGQPRDDEVASCLEYLGMNKMVDKRFAFDAVDELEELRIHRIMEESGDSGRLLIVGNGNEFMRLRRNQGRRSPIHSAPQLHQSSRRLQPRQSRSRGTSPT